MWYNAFMLDTNDLQLKSRDELIRLVTLSQEKLTKKEDAITANKTEITIHKSKITSLEMLVNVLTDQVKLLKHSKFGRSSEKYMDDNPQGRLFDEAVLPSNQEAIEADEEEITIPEHKRKKHGKKHGKKSLDKNLPREVIVHDLSDTDKICGCGKELTCIGDETTEQLDIIPAKIYVIQHVCKKYSCKHCKETIKTAKKPKQPIPRSIAAPGLLANVLTSKFQFHLPLYRQEKMIQAIGAEIPRNTLSLWVIKCSKLLQPLVNLLQDEILDYDIAYADESTLQVLKEPNKTAQSKSYLWAFGGGPPDRFCYLYQYHSSRKHQIAKDFFHDFKGYLHCDGYYAYDNLAKDNPDVKQAGCWYHMRRKFTDASKVSKKAGMADWFLKQIQRLAKIEKYIKHHKFAPNQTKAYRDEHAPSIIDKIKAKLDELQDQTPEQGLLGKAIHYALRQWPKLQRYLEDGRLDISNNRMERSIKPFAVGRKNWLFANSVDGAHAAANIFSLIETCKAHNVNPYDWLRETLTKVPVCETLEQLEALMPFHFRKGNR